MQFPLSFLDISLWLAATAIILRITTELVSPYYKQINLLIDKKKLGKVTLIMETLFVISVMIRVISIISML